MYDPMTVAHEIYLPFYRDKHGNKKTLFTIWHVDPETDGSDDSCGWFKRAHHFDKALYEGVIKDFEFEFKYWFNDGGYPVFSVIGTAINMYKTAAWRIFNYKSKKYDRFMRKYLFDIIRFAENPVDSLFDSITMKFGVEKKEKRVKHFASIVFADIMRKLQPWYKHPRWHIHHWKIQFRPWQQFKRRYWDKCSVCGKRGFKESAYSDWNGTSIWHQSCDRSAPKMVTS